MSENNIYPGAGFAWQDLIACAEQAALWSVDPAKYELEALIANKVYYEWASKSVLDIGCGVGRYGLTLPVDMVDLYVGIDQSLPMITIAEYKMSKSNGIAYKLIRAKAEEISISSPFDLGIMMHVLQHLDNPSEFLAEILQRYNCHRWCFTFLTWPGESTKLLNIGDGVAANARPMSEIQSIVKAVNLDIEEYSVQKAVGVNDAQELLFWTIAK